MTTTDQVRLKNLQQQQQQQQQQSMSWSRQPERRGQNFGTLPAQRPAPAPATRRHPRPASHADDEANSDEEEELAEQQENRPFIQGVPAPRAAARAAPQLGVRSFNANSPAVLLQSPLDSGVDSGSGYARNEVPDYPGSPEDHHYNHSQQHQPPPTPGGHVTLQSRQHIPIPPPPREPPPSTPRSSTISHYAASDLLKQQAPYCTVPAYYPQQGFGNNRDASIPHAYMLPAADSKEYDTARPIDVARNAQSPLAQGSVTSGQYPNSGTDSSGSKLMCQTTFSKKLHRPRCPLRLAIVTLGIAAIVLLAIVIFLAARSAELERRIEENLPQNGSLFGIFNPNSLPIRMRQSQAYDVTLGSSGFWSGRYESSDNNYLVVNVTLPQFRVAGLYIRKSSLPTLVQHDFFHKLINLRSEEAQAVSVVHYVTAGVWYMSVINDGQLPLRLQVSAERTDKNYELPNCLNECSNRGICLNDSCNCFEGFKGPDCSVADAVKECSGNGRFIRGSCLCSPQWKGRECEIPWSECADPLCSGNGRCIAGRCSCDAGFNGDVCQLLTCQPANCNNNGACINGRCRCYSGWTGAGCNAKSAQVGSDAANCAPSVQLCNGRGTIRGGRCHCRPGYEGDSCETESCLVDCVHGTCSGGSCVCQPGWGGLRCHLRLCDSRCEQHGVCVNGTCHCDKGWNGRSCTLDGCPNSCSNQGNCELNSITGEWGCNCVGGNSTQRGYACEFAVEKLCDDNIDNDNDGLTDCYDPDCCRTYKFPKCVLSDLCISGEIPLKALFSVVPLAPVASFFDRVKFLIGPDSVQLNAAKALMSEYETASVIIGRLVLPDGKWLPNGLISDRNNPELGYTKSTETGYIHLLVNGGKTVNLQVARKISDGTRWYNTSLLVYAPMHNFVHIGDILINPKEALSRNRRSEASAAGSGGQWLFDGWPQLYVPEQAEQLALAQQQMCASSRNSSARMLQLLPPLQFSDYAATDGAAADGVSVRMGTQTFGLQLPLADSQLRLVYTSSRRTGYLTELVVQLTQSVLPDGLVEVFCYVSVAGYMFKERFEANPNITHVFQWDRTDRYGRSYFGLVLAKVSVGYKFKNCPRIEWQHQAIELPGAGIEPAPLGQWTLAPVHAYDPKQGLIHRGDGVTEYLSLHPMQVSQFAGNGQKRSSSCSRCNGPLNSSQLLLPVALAATSEGEVIIGDGRHLRMAAADGAADSQLMTVAELPKRFDSSTYSLAVDRTRLHREQVIYVSDPLRRQILQLRLVKGRSVRETRVVAGNGRACRGRLLVECGDGGDALKASLVAPKGLVVDMRGALYFADGPNIRRIVPRRGFLLEESAIVETVAGLGIGVFDSFAPWPCEQQQLARSAALRWPTAVAYSSVEDCVYFADDNSVFRLGRNGVLEVAAGQPPHCPSRAEGGEAQYQQLERPVSIAIDLSGRLLVLTHSAKLLRVEADGRMRPLPLAAGSSLTPSPSAMAFSMLNQLFVSDTSAVAVLRIAAPKPRKLPGDRYRVLSEDSRQLFTFDSWGKHLTTADAITGEQLVQVSHSAFFTQYGGTVKAVNLMGQLHELEHSLTLFKVRVPSGKTVVVHYNNLDLVGSIVTDGIEEVSLAYYEPWYYGYFRETQSLLKQMNMSDGRMWTFDYVSEESKSGRVSRDGTVQLFCHLRSITFPNGECGEFVTQLMPLAGFKVRWLLGDTEKFAVRRGFSVELSNSGTTIESIRVNNELQTQTVCQNCSSLQLKYDGFQQRSEQQLELQTARIMQLQQQQLLTAAWKYNMTASGISSSSSSKVGHMTALRQFAADDSKSWQSESAKLGAKTVKALHVNGKQLLTVTYDTATRIESYSIGQMGRYQLLFNIKYNSRLQVTDINPNHANCQYRSLHLGYTENGQLAEMRWADKPRTHSESTVILGKLTWSYDHLGRVASEVQHHSRDGAARNWKIERKYLYSDNSLLPSTITNEFGGHYRLFADKAKNLQKVLTPSARQIWLQVERLLGRTRLLQRATGEPEAGTQLEMDSLNRLLQLRYPSGQKRLTNLFNSAGSLRKRVIGSSFDEWIFEGGDGRVVAAVATDAVARVALRQQFGYHDNRMLRSERLLPRGDGGRLREVQQEFVHDATGRLVSTTTTVLPARIRSVTNATFDPERGHVTSLGGLQLHYKLSQAGHECVVNDSASERRFLFDSLGRLTETTLHFGSSRAFVLSVHAVSAGSLQRLVFRVGTEGAFCTVEYEKDDGGRVTTVSRKLGKRLVSEEEIDYDEEGRIRRQRFELQDRAHSLDARGLPTSVGSVMYTFDTDGFLAERRNFAFAGQREFFDFDAAGRLRRVETRDAAGRMQRSDTFVYDAEDRLVARLGELDASNDVQLVYSDSTSRQQVTHVLQLSSGRLFRFVREPRTQQLVAMETNGERFNIVCDYFGSPLAVLHSSGSVLNQIDYSFTGRATVAKQALPLLFGYRGGFSDSGSGLLWLQGRWYDPYSGQWATPDSQRLQQRLQRVRHRPELLHSYNFDHVSGGWPSVYSFHELTQPQHWLAVFNINWRNLLPSAAASWTKWNGDDLVRWQLVEEANKELRRFNRPELLQQQRQQQQQQQQPLSAAEIPLHPVARIAVSPNSSIALKSPFSWPKPVLALALLLNDSVSLLPMCRDVGACRRECRFVSTVGCADAARRLKPVFADGSVLRLGHGAGVVSQHRQPDGCQRLWLNATTAADATVGAERRLSTSISLQFGADVAEERRRLRESILSDTAAEAWRLEASVVGEGRRSWRRSWSDKEVKQLLEQGRVAGFKAKSLHEEEEQELLALTDPAAFEFVPDA